MEKDKILLEKHIESIFQALGFTDLTFRIFETRLDEIDHLIEAFDEVCEYIIQVEQADSKDILQLSRFIGKQVKEIGENYYWTEGERIQHNSISLKHLDSNHTSTPEVVTLPHKTKLPSWLDQYLFNELEAKFAPDHHRYCENLNLNKHELQVYLGTYFPRSYAESFCIWDNLLQNQEIRKRLNENVVNILDVGCGTGGNLVGFLSALNKHELVKEVNITLVDGNHSALSIAAELAKNTCERFGLLHQVQTVHYIKNDLKQFPKFTQKFDYIMSFKMINELIPYNNKAYNDFAKYALPKLSNRGLLLLCDVTTKTGNEFNPILMNRQLNHFIAHNQEYQTLLPHSCRHHECDCHEICFTQRLFQVSHLQKSKDKSLVAYRIMGKRNFISQLPAPSRCNYINKLHTDYGLLDSYCVKAGKKYNVEIDNYKL